MAQTIENIFEKYFESLLTILPNLVVGGVILIIFVIAGKILKRTVGKRLKKKMDDLLLVNFISRVVSLLFIVVGIVIFLNEVGLGGAASGLLAGAGVSALVIGFAFRDIGENFLAGIFLAVGRPFSIGDVIECEGTKGVVKGLKFRDSHVRTFDGRDVFIPNSFLIKNSLSNYTRDGLLRHDFLIGIDYGDSPVEAIKVILETLKKNPDIGQADGIKPFVAIEEFATSTINLKVYYWTNTNTFEGDIVGLKNNVMYEVIHAVAERFSLPADIVELKIYQDGNPIPLKIMEDTTE